MVDAVFSSVTTSTLIRATAEQQSSARSFAANPNKIQEAPQAPFVSPYIGRDHESQRVVIQIRNGETGKVIEQIPSKPETQQQAPKEPAQRVEQVQSQQQQATPAPQAQAPSGQATPAASAASFGAFARAQSGGSATGSTVSISA